MLAKALLFGLACALSACSSEQGEPKSHGGRDDPIATAEAGYAPRIAELTAKAQVFAAQHRLDFHEVVAGDARILVLSDNTIRIENTLRPGGLRVVAIGSVTPASIKLARDYIDQTMAVPAL